MSCGFDHFTSRHMRHRVTLTRILTTLRTEWKGVIDDLGTVLLAGLCIAGLVIVASTFDGDLQGSDEIVAAVLGTLSLFAILAGLEVADRVKLRRRR
jgi:hypothetical protein